MKTLKVLLLGLVLSASSLYSGQSLAKQSGKIDGSHIENLQVSELYTDSTAVTSTAAELNILDTVTSTAAELNILDGVTSTAAELNILDGVTATAAEINDAADASGQTLATEAGTGADGSDSYDSSWRLVGGIYETRILIDIDGLNDGGTTLDIIGEDGGTANCHIGQIIAAESGTTFAIEMICLEAPAGGGADIDLYFATEATGAEDALVTGLTETLLINGGTQSAGTTSTTATAITADAYLYLAGVTASDATYTAGKFLITIYGI